MKSSLLGGETKINNQKDRKQEIKEPATKEREGRGEEETKRTSFKRSGGSGEEG